MVSDMRNVFSIRLYRRLVSVTVTSIYILCCVPQEGVCFAFNKNEPRHFVHEILNNIEENKSDLLIEQFDALEESIEASQDPLDEGRIFLHSFIEEINSKYSMNLTFQDACLLVRNNLHTLQLSEEIQSVILTTIELMEPDFTRTTELMKNFEQITRLDATKSNISWPWEWNWFGLNNKKHKNTKEIGKSHRIHSYGEEVEIPGAVCAGAAEVLAGAIACVLGTVFPPAYAVGAGLILDGTNRMINGAQEMDKQRENGPGSYPSPANVNF